MLEIIKIVLLAKIAERGSGVDVSYAGLEEAQKGNTNTIAGYDSYSASLYIHNKHEFVGREGVQGRNYSQGRLYT